MIYTGYYVFRKWYFKDAKSKWNASELLKKAELTGNEKDFFEGEWAKEEEPRGWIGNIKKQVIGK